MLPQNCTVGITGASGLIGQRIANLASAAGNRVIGFSRQARQAIRHCASVRPMLAGRDVDLSGIDVIIHLAGESIIGYWSEGKKERIISSRRETTRALVRSMAELERKPSAFLCASGTGFYGNRGDIELDENAPRGEGFLAEVAQVWEEEAAQASALYGVRVCSLRTGMVLAREGGAFPLLRRIFKLGLGGKLGSGKQHLPWIHLHDIAALFLFCAGQPEMRGAINASSPEVATNTAFTQALASILHRPAICAAPAFVLKMALRDQASLLLDSQRVIPVKALAHGYAFAHPRLDQALQELTKN